MDDKESSLINYLILSGALEPAGISGDGEPLYNFTPKLKDVMPELYDIHQNNINSEIMRFWEMGIVNIDFFADSPIVTLTDKAFNDDFILGLSKEDLFVLDEIKRVMLS